jgi:hypothetical protein
MASLSRGLGNNPKSLFLAASRRENAGVSYLEKAMANHKTSLAGGCLWFLKNFIDKGSGYFELAVPSVICNWIGLLLRITPTVTWSPGLKVNKVLT